MAISLHEFLTSIQAQGVSGASHKWKGLCRAHDDTRHSLRVELASSGKVLLHCDVCRGSGKSSFDVLRAFKDASLWPIDVGSGRPIQMALTSARANERSKDLANLEWVPEPSTPVPTPREYVGLTIAAVHLYSSIAGRPSGAVIRYHHQSTDRLGKPEKEFRPLFCFRVDGKEQWRTKAPTTRPLYGLQKLRERDKAVLLVEGEKTADKAQEIFPNLCVVSAFGGLNGFQRTDITPLADRDVVVWPDHDTNWQANLRAWVAKLVPEGKLAVKSLRTVTLPASLPEKWDLADPIPDGIDPHALLRNGLLYVSCPDSVSSIQTLAQLEAGLYQVIEPSGLRYVWNPTKVEFLPTTFDQYFVHFRSDMGSTTGQPIRPSTWANTYTRQTKRRCTGRAYEPTNEIMVQADGELAYNVYVDPKIPAVQGDVSEWLGFLRFLLGDEQAHLFNCPLANLMQYPQRKCRYATILVGQQGIGKSIALGAYEKLVGDRNCSRPTTSEIEDRFNAYAGHVQVINLIELSGSTQAYRQLLDVIADSEVRVHRKNLEPQTIKNYCTVIGSSNEEVPIKIADETERRWLFLMCKANAANRNNWNYQKLVDWIQSHLPQLRYFYLNYDLQDWDPNKLPAYGLEVKQRMAYASMPPYEQEYVACLNNRFHPLDKDLFTRTQFASAVSMHFRMKNEKNVIRKHGGGFLKGLVRHGKGLRTEEIYVVRDINRYEQLSPEELGRLTGGQVSAEDYM